MRLHQIGRDHAARGRSATMPVNSKLPGIRGSHPARLLGAVERQRVGAEFLAPERLLETFGEQPRLGFELARLIVHPRRRAQRAASRLPANT